MKCTPSFMFRKRDGRCLTRSQKHFLRFHIGGHVAPDLGRLFGVDLCLFWRELRLNLWMAL